MGGDILVGVLVLVVGLVVALNIRGSAAKMAAGYRRFPWWIRWSVTSTEWGVRLWALLFVVGGIVFLVIGLRNART